jgi:CdiI N-terminal domain
VFRIRFFTPEIPDENALPQAGAELQLGPDRLHFVVDLQHWPMAAYERQWREGIGRVAHGAASTALMTAYRGSGDEPHRMWALWREGDQIYVQEVSVLPADLDAPFDPSAPYEHVGDRVPASEEGLPIAEYRYDLIPLLAAYFFPQLPWR